MPPVHAHQTEISGDIGATLHIEPNDIPRAGVESLAWFALTRRGGETVPLSACDCSLALYSLPDTAQVASPVLESVSAEGYEHIPGAMVIFPDVGAYELVLVGTPQTDGDFQPFEFRFEVTVATGAPQTTAEVPSSTPDSAPASSIDPGTPDASHTTPDSAGNRATDTSLTESEPIPNPPATSPGAIAPSLIGLGVVIVVLIIGSIGWVAQKRGESPPLHQKQRR